MTIYRYLQTAAAQLAKIESLSYVVRPFRPLTMKKHLQNMVADYKNANKHIHVKLACNLRDAPDLAPFQSVALLIISEFLDNAVDAANRKGAIAVKVSWERSLHQLRITVSDDGPGVPHDLVADLYQRSRTTKGEGRGMGLMLVKQACDAFHGSTQYLRDDRTSFVAALRLPEQPERRVAEQTDQALLLIPTLDVKVTLLHKTLD